MCRRGEVAHLDDARREDLDHPGPGGGEDEVRQGRAVDSDDRLRRLANTWACSDTDIPSILSRSKPWRARNATRASSFCRRLFRTSPRST